MLIDIDWEYFLFLIEIKANFKKECGSDNKCQTDIKLEARLVDIPIG